MNDLSLFPLAFYVVAGVTVASAAGVAFSESIVYSAFALMGALLGVAGLFVLLAADFLAAVQVLIYVGGVLVLTIFAVMLTHRIGDVRITNRSLGRVPAAAVLAVIGAGMTAAVRRAPWHRAAVGPPAPTTYAIGDGFLKVYLLPFELASLVLLAALVGAVMLSRKEVKGG